MSDAAAKPRLSNAYELFIFLLTILSLLTMVALLLPLAPQTLQLLRTYDLIICIVFLFDFGLRLKRAPSSSGYFFRERGWLDLLGSIPNLGLLKFTALLRLARLSRVVRVIEMVRRGGTGELTKDVLANRGKYAGFVTLVLAGTVLSVASVLMVQTESRVADANITTGGDALWWGIVTITTVGYGDQYPVTAIGRVIAAFVMFAGVGIIGALASILASILIPQPKELDGPNAGLAEVQAELAAVNRELADIRELLAGGRTGA